MTGEGHYPVLAFRGGRAYCKVCGEWMEDEYRIK